MTINEYQKEALRTAQTDKLNPEERLLNGVMGLNGEAGEAIDIVKKHIFQGHDLDVEHVARSSGILHGISQPRRTRSVMTSRQSLE